MADSWNAVGSAVYSRLAPPLGSALYDAVARVTVTPPYTVWQVLDTDDDYTFGNGGSTTESLFVMVKTISDRYYPDEARTIYGTVHTYMQNAPLSVGGYTVLRCQRDGSRFQYQDNEKFWHVGATYRLEIQPT